MEELEYDTDTKSLKRNYKKKKMLTSDTPYGELVQATCADDKFWFEQKWLVLCGTPASIVQLIDTTWPMAEIEMNRIADILLSRQDESEPIMISYPLHGYVGRAMQRNPKNLALRETHKRIVADMYDMPADRIYIFEPELAL